MTARLDRIMALASAALLAAGAGPGAAQRPAPANAALTEPLVATTHPPLPKDPVELWMAPGPPARRTPAALVSFRNGTKLFGQARYAEALSHMRVSLAGSALADYGLYYRGLTELRLSRPDEAARTFDTLASRQLTGYLTEAVPVRQAEIAEARGDARRAAAIYARLSAGTPVSPEDMLMRLARASLAAGDTAAGAQALARLYYEYPISDEAALAQAQLDERRLWQPLEPGSSRYTFELGRAERLFGARRYAQARSAYELVAPAASGDDRERTSLRLAECDFYLKRYRASVEALEPWTRTASRRAEAQFFYLSSLRETGAYDEYVRMARELVNAFPEESWAEETLNNLATHYILQDEDERADAVFREILERYPQGRHAQRAAWKSGWMAYRNGRYDDTIRRFEQAAARFPRSDYRPSWLYWSARAHDRLGHTEEATGRYALVVTDYQNSYYGRLAANELKERKAAPARTTASPVPSDTSPGAPLPPTEGLIRELIAQDLYDDAMNELTFAQRTWGDSPAIQATMALVYSRTGELRRAINLMKRAYPQYIAAGGEDLPVEMLEVLFPVAYWDVLKKHAIARGLDPYLVAALTAQESTFDPEIRSHANAVGLMQVLPSMGRRYARRLKIRRFSPGMLTRPEVNVRIGTAIFADLVDRFGGAHLALASYNAGEGAVARWVSERPGIPRDEFIDDIPYPETQNYVKRIVGTAEDYRRVYGELGATPGRPPASLSPGKVTKPGSVTTPKGSKVTPAKDPSQKSSAKKGSTKKSSTTKKKTASTSHAGSSRHQ